MLSVNTNFSALVAQRHLAATQGALAQTTQRLSSGLRINAARDDAAGLAISERLLAQINGLSVATRNANEAISMAQIGDEAAGSVVDALQRMREIAVQASNGTLTTSDRANLEVEFDELQAEVASVIAGTDYDGTELLAGSTSLTLQVGANAGDTVTITNPDLSALTGGTSVTSGSVSVAGATTAAASAAITAIDSALTTATAAQATWGAYQNRFDAVVSGLASRSENLSTARGRIVDADYASETAQRARLLVLQEAGVAMLAQANAAPSLVLSLLGAS